MDRIGRGARNLILIAACAGVLILGNLFVRFSYIHAYRSHVEAHRQHRLMQAGSLARGLETRMRGLEGFLGVVAECHAYRDWPVETRMVALKEMLPHALELGGVDLFWIRREGVVRAAGQTDIGVSGHSLLARSARGGGFSPWIKYRVPFETRDGRRGKGVVVLIPVKSSARSGGGIDQIAGYLAALVSLEDFVSENAGLEMSASRYVAIVDARQAFVYHPDLDFVGAKLRKAMDLDRFGRLKKVVKKMVGGGEGAGAFTHYDSREGKREVEWQAVYAPVRVRGRQWSVAVFEEGVGADFARGIRRGHLALALVFSLMVLGVGGVLYWANRRVYALEHKVKGLQDATALGGILRSVNRELAEAKQALEVDVGEYDVAIRRVRRAAERLIEASSRLGETIRRPTKSQKQCMRDVRFEASRLRGGIGKLGKK